MSKPGIIDINWIDSRIEELRKSKTKFKEHNLTDWIEIPDYKISILEEVKAKILSLEEVKKMQLKLLEEQKRIVEDKKETNENI